MLRRRDRTVAVLPVQPSLSQASPGWCTEGNVSPFLRQQFLTGNSDWPHDSKNFSVSRCTLQRPSCQLYRPASGPASSTPHTPHPARGSAASCLFALTAAPHRDHISCHLFRAQLCLGNL